MYTYHYVVSTDYTSVFYACATSCCVCALHHRSIYLTFICWIVKAWDHHASHLNIHVIAMLRQSGKISPYVLFIAFLVLSPWFVTRKWHPTPFKYPPPHLMRSYAEDTERERNGLTTSTERPYNVRQERFIHKNETFVGSNGNSQNQENVIAEPNTSREQGQAKMVDDIRYNPMPAMKKHNNSKIILAWNSFFRARDYYEGFGSKPFARCRLSNCIFTDDHRYLSGSSAILFSAGDIEPFPDYRDPRQLHVFFVTESPDNYPWLDLEHEYNLTMTYRLDSDIPRPYAEIYKKLTVESTYKMKYPFAQRTRTVAWVASNCQSASRREDYVHELQRYIDVDIYGACGNMTGCGLRWEDTDCVKKKIPSTYKFYLAFENSLCEDYVTEKLFRCLVTEIVPIVYGGTNYSRDAPPHSVINVEDYKSPQELARYLKRVAANETEYNAYFEWNKRYGVNRFTRPFCKLCEYANKLGFHKSYKNITSWWFDDKCKAPIDVIK